jgi:hypothetical protein
MTVEASTRLTGNIAENQVPDCELCDLRARRKARPVRVDVQGLAGEDNGVGSVGDFVQARQSRVATSGTGEGGDGQAGGKTRQDAEYH